MILATLCYVKHAGRTLMVHRTKSGMIDLMTRINRSVVNKRHQIQTNVYL